LAALRAFEAAARHRSFTKAAAELFLTQSAVSRHIRNLEEWLDRPLFLRNHRAIVLTPEGEIYMREIVAAFSRMDVATRRIRRAGSQDVLHIHAYATFAMRWLIPRLKRFQDDHPEIDLRLTASVRPVDFQRDEIHAAIRTGNGDWGAAIRADKLFESRLIPVCSPALVQSGGELRHPNDLRHTTLLHSLARASDWSQWLTAAQADEVDPDRGLKFESSIMTYLAAQQGLGVAIAQEFLVQEDIRQGTLIQPFVKSISSDHTYYFLSSPRYIDYPVLEIFRTWLLSEVPGFSTPSLGPAVS
jgi:LysR family glycine cleavage system transcriptional activator